VPRWLYTGCAGLVVLVIVAVLIVVGWNALRGQQVAINQEATPTLSSGLRSTPQRLRPLPALQLLSPLPTRHWPSRCTQTALLALACNTLGLAGERGRPASHLRPPSRRAYHLHRQQNCCDGRSFCGGLQAESIAGSSSELLTQFAATLPTKASAVETGFRSVGQTEWAISQVALAGSSAMPEMTAYAAATSRGGQVYTVLAAAPAADWSTFAPIFQQMFDSFRFTAAPQVALASPTLALAKTPAMTVSVTATVKTVTTSVMTSTPSAKATPATYVCRKAIHCWPLPSALTLPWRLSSPPTASPIRPNSRLGSRWSSRSAGSAGGCGRHTYFRPGCDGHRPRCFHTGGSPPTREPTPTPAPTKPALSGKLIFPSTILIDHTKPTWYLRHRDD